MQITRIIEWDMAHRVPNHGGKCSNLHGHRYRMELTVDGKVKGNNGKADDGMVIDFGILEAVAKNWIDAYLDHGYMGQLGKDDGLIRFIAEQNWKLYPVAFPPTAENIAQHILEHMRFLFKDRGVTVTRIRLYETPKSFAEVT